MPENQPSGTPGQLPIDVKNVDENGMSRLEVAPKLAPVAKSGEATKDANEGRAQANVADQAAGNPPAPKTYTEEELNQRIESIKGGHKGTVEKMRADIAKLNATIADLSNKAEEANLAAYLQQIEAKGGDVEAAKAVINLQRQSRQALAAVQAKEAELAEKEAMLNEAGRGKFAHDMLKQYGLAEADLPKLLEATDDVDMERRALKLHVASLTNKARAPEAPDHAANKAKGIDTSKMPIATRMGMAMEGQI